MQNPELFACLSKERKENLLGTLLFRPSIYERLYYEEEMIRKQIVCYEEFLQIVRNPQIRAAAPEIDFEFEEFSANSYLSLVDEYLYWNKVPGDILLRLKKAAEDALAYARENKNFRQNEETLLGTPHTIQGYLGEISISEMLDAYVNGCETMEGVHASIDKTREFLFYCGMFHDAGKLYFLDTINLFARSLFNEEFDLIRPPRCATDSVGRAYSSSKNFADMLADLRCNAGRMFNPDLVQLFVSKISCRLLTSRIIRLCESRDCCTCLHGLIRNIAHGANTF